MQKTERGAPLGGQAFPMAARGLQQGVRADDVGLDEGRRAVNGSVHMRLGREVEHGVGLEGLVDAVHGGVVADVGPLERIARVPGRIAQ